MPENVGHRSHRIANTRNILQRLVTGGKGFLQSGAVAWKQAKAKEQDR